MTSDTVCSCRTQFLIAARWVSRGEASLPLAFQFPLLKIQGVLGKILPDALHSAHLTHASERASERASSGSIGGSRPSAGRSLRWGQVRLLASRTSFRSPTLEHPEDLLSLLISPHLEFGAPGSEFQIQTPELSTHELRGKTLDS